MTNEHNSVSRRNVLAGLGAVGAGGALVGAGTSAYFSDQETFSGNELVAGELDLKLDWQQKYWGASDDERPQDYGSAGRPYVNAHPDHDEDGEQSYEFDDGSVWRYGEYGRNIREEDGIDYCTDLDEDYYFGAEQDSLIELTDVKPGDCGEITFSYHLCDNPGWLWLGATNVGYDETLADRIDAKLWYDLDGDNEHDEDEPIIVDGSMKDVLEALAGGLLLDGEPASTTGSKAHDDCIELPKLDGDNLSEYTDPPRDDPADLRSGDVITFDEGIEITLTNVDVKDGDEAYGFDWTSDVGLCEIAVGGGGQGGPKTETYDYECETSGSDVIAPENEGGQQAAISNLTFSFCKGEEPDDPVCVTNSTTGYLGFEWCLPERVGNEVQGNAIDFDLQFYTEQCRHNPDPTNPFQNGSRT